MVLRQTARRLTSPESASCFCTIPLPKPETHTFIATDVATYSIDASGDLAAFVGDPLGSGEPQVYLYDYMADDPGTCAVEGLTQITDLPGLSEDDWWGRGAKISSGGNRIAVTTNRDFDGTNFDHRAELLLIDIADPLNPQYTRISRADDTELKHFDFDIDGDGDRLVFFDSSKPPEHQFFLARCTEPCDEIDSPLELALCNYDGLLPTLVEWPEFPLWPFHLQAFRWGFELRFPASETEWPSGSLRQPYTLRMRYTERDLIEAGITDPREIQLYTLKEARGGSEWVLVKGTTWIDVENGEIIASADFGGLFVFATESSSSRRSEPMRGGGR